MKSRSIGFLYRGKNAVVAASSANSLPRGN